MTANERTARIARAIDVVCDSLRTHLPYTHGNIGADRKKLGETNAFHKKCVKEYAEVIDTLAELL